MHLERVKIGSGEEGNAFEMALQILILDEKLKKKNMINIEIFNFYIVLSLNLMTKICVSVKMK